MKTIRKFSIPAGLGWIRSMSSVENDELSIDTNKNSIFNWIMMREWWVREPELNEENFNANIFMIFSCIIWM